MERVRRAPGIGKLARMALIGGFLLGASVADAQRFHYHPPVRPEPPAPATPSPPALPYRALPADDRIAPDDFTLDEIDEPIPTAAEQAALDRRVAALVPGQNYEPHPALWRIGIKRLGGRDTTIWLFGTVHVLPPGFRWRSPLVEQVAARAGTLIVESVDDPGGGYGFVPAGAPRLAPLNARVSPSHRAKLAALTATLPPAAVATLDALPTWLAAVAVSVARDIRAGDVPGPGADDWFEARFRAAGKPVVAIEDGAAVAASANAIPEAEARALLDRALDAPAFDLARARAPLHAWAQGQVGPASPIVVALPSASLTDSLLARRNAAWAATLKAKLRTPGTMLFVAGAGHFIGAGSVLERLAAAGVTVTRVE